MKNLLTLLTCSSLVAASASAGIYSLFTDISSEAGINERHESDGSTYIAATVDGSGSIGSGDALRLADLSADDKPEAVWNSAAFGGSDITSAFRVDLDAFLNMTATTGSVDINFRMSDSGDSISTSSNQLNTISFEESGKLKVNGSTKHTFAGATSVSFLINVDTVNPLLYTFGDQTNTTLGADSIATFVEGLLVSTDSNNNGAGFDPLSGVNKIGFIGESDSKMGVDYLFDNVVLYTGADAGVIPEPSVFSLLLGAFALGFVARRRR